MERLLSAGGTDQEGPSLLSVGVARVWSLLLAMAAAVEWTVEGHPLWEVIELLCAGEGLAAEHSLHFIKRTLWPQPGVELVIHYRKNPNLKY